MRRAVLAVLAVGALLGLGTTFTLASWNDHEYASSRFTTGIFQTQSQGSDGVWASHSSNAAMMTFGGTLAPGGTAAAPQAGGPAYTWINLRTMPSSTLNGVATLSAADSGNTGAYPYVEFRAYTRPVSTAQCVAPASGATYIVGGSSTWAKFSNAPFSSSQSVNVDLTGTGVCFEIRLTQTASTAAAGAILQGAPLNFAFTFTFQNAHQ